MLACACSVGARGPITISIVGTNDLHGGVSAAEGRGGLALLDGYLRNLRAERARDGGAVVLLDAGDLFQGTLESNLNEGAVVIAAYNALRYDAATIGNHEFDFGPVGPAVSPESPDDDPQGALKTRIREARFPFLAANIIDKNTSRSIAWDNVRPSIILNARGVRIGVVGLTTMDTLTSTLTANTRSLDVVPLAPTLEQQARLLRSQGATIVVGLAHAGGKCTKFDNPSDLSSCVADAEIFRVARALPPGLVDVIVAGHRHEGIAHEVAGVAIMSAYSSGRAFGRIDLSVEKTSGRVLSRRLFPPQDLCEHAPSADGQCGTDQAAIAQYLGKPVVASHEIESILAPAVAAARSFKDASLGVTIDDRLQKDDDDDESAVGNVLADWMREASGADVAIANTGGIRASLPAGTLTYAQLFELTPFDNRQALMTLTGAEVVAVVKHDLEARRSGVILSGVRATATCGIAGLHVTLRRESGGLVTDTEPLKVVTSDFLATGGNDMLTPVMPFRQPGDLNGPIVRDEIADWLRQSGGRWRSQDVFDPGRRRVAFEGRRPLRCQEGR